MSRCFGGLCFVEDFSCIELAVEFLWTNTGVGVEFRLGRLGIPMRRIRGAQNDYGMKEENI